MKKITKIVALAALAALVSGCGASSTNPTPNTNVANVGANVLQFAVGTANLYGAQTALNVVVTYRQPSNGYHPGDSGTLLNSPSITLPAALGGATGTPEGYDGCSTAGTGAAVSEAGGTKINSTGQQAGEPCATTQTTFGQSGGAFATGLEPYNATAAGDFTPPGVNGQGKPFQVAPYAVPIYGGNNPDPGDSFVPWLGPPSFDYTGNSESIAICNAGSCPPAGYKGWPGGIDVFSGVAPVAGGAYTLSLSVPGNTGTVNVSKSFTLTSAAPLATPVNPAFTPDGAGGGTFAFTMPAGTTEAIVEVEDVGNGGATCNGSSAGTPIYYTLEATASGTLTLPDKIGPIIAINGSPTPSICSAALNAGTADTITIQTIGFDYPYAEMVPPKGLGNPNPAIVGGAGQDDITIAAPTTSHG
jgi:hypothetical protein